MMRFVFVFLFTLITSVSFGQNGVDLGNQAMTAGTYNEALEHYEAVLSAGMESSEMYANMGMAAYKLGDLAKATLYYEKVLKKDPHHSEVSQLLNRINQELPIRISTIPDFILTRWWRTFYRLLSSNLWVVCQVMLLVIMLYLLYRWWFVNRTTAMNRLMMGTGIVVLLNVIVLFAASNKRNDERGGIAGVVMKSTSLYQGADERSEVIIDLGPGNKVFFEDEIAEWYKVILEDKDVGWIRKELVEKI